MLGQGGRSIDLLQTKMVDKAATIIIATLTLEYTSSTDDE